MSSENTAPPALTMLSEEEAMFRDAIRDFAQAEIQPRAREMDKNACYDESLLGSVFEMGLMGIEIPEELGGSGASFFQACLAVEEVSRADAAVGALVDVQNTLFNNAVLRWGSVEQKQAHLSRVARDTVGAYALSEAGPGSDAFALACRAEPKGEDWVLDGQKLWISNAGGA